MHVKTVEELLESGPMEFEAVTGTIANIYERRTGGNEKRAWSVQNIILRGESRLIRCAIWNQPELDSAWKDRMVYIIAGRGKRDVQMLATEEDDYKGEKRIILKVQDKATFTTKDPTATTPPPVQSAPPPPQAPQHTPALPPEQHQSEPPITTTPQQAPAPTNAREAWAKADATLQTIRRGYLRCAMVANRILEDCKVLGIPFPEDGLQSMTATLFIQFKDRGGLMQVPDCDPAQPSPKAQQHTNAVDNEDEFRY